MRSLLALVLVAVTVPSPAAVLCLSRNGSVHVRDACRARETQADPVALGLQGPPGPQGLPGWERPCPPDSVQVGTLCVDKYEASVWSIPGTNTALIEKVKRGEASLDDLMAGGATQYGYPLPPFNLINFPPTFPVNGNWTEALYAVSIPGVLPATNITWFQAEQACRLVDKRLPTNQEWQAAAAGTPDPGTADDGVSMCNTLSAGPALTGARTACVSAWGAHDMVGNVWEWVADWDERATVCTSWPDAFGGDRSCFGGDGSVSALPGALRRGGSWPFGVDAGVFAVVNDGLASFFGSDLGFRCAR